MSNNISAKIILDSISPEGMRLTTAELTFHRFILAEFNTHRVFSRNSASSRAIPFSKQIKNVAESPALPVEYMYNQPGMQASEPLTPEDEAEAIRIILEHRDHAIKTAKALGNLGPINPDTGKPLGLHKQWTNRYLEPFMWHTVIVTATDFNNYFHQRCTEFSPLAQPEIRAVSDLFIEEYRNSTPTILTTDQWHLPYIMPDEESLPLEDRIKISVARCARVSYLTHDGVRDIIKDFDLFNKLVTADPPHWSPLEHVARPLNTGIRATSLDVATRHIGNFNGWVQYRHILDGTTTFTGEI